MEKTAYRASVHAVVEFALMGGDLVPVASAARLLEGVRGHRSLQDVAEEGVLNEVPVRCTVEGARVSLTVHGRIDRLHRLDTLEEIKTVLGQAPEQGDPLHWAQAECYAHMLCQQEDLPFLNVRITYLNLSDGDITRLTRTLTRETLAERFQSYVAPYLARLDRMDAHRAALRGQMEALTFPYPAYRAGQRELAAEIYRTIRDGKMLLAQAPTGTGKTMAALFPALKGVGAGCVERIFYLTARTTARQAAFDALSLLPANELRAIALYARESCCAQERPICRSGLCARQTGYYDRLPAALDDALAQDGLFTRERVRQLADAHGLCPFEFSLDLSLECDVIVCDYNYVFDPRVRLQRYATGGRKGQVLLIDEAHNLPDRARDMYSAALSVRQLNAARKSIDKSRRREPLYLSLRALCKAICAAAAEGDLPRAERDPRPDIAERCEDALCALGASDALPGEAASQLSLALSSYLYHAAHWDENDFLLFSGGKTSPTLTLFCADAAQKTAAVLKRSRAAVLFSATLSPMEFYKTLTGASPDAACVYLLSPFPPENLLVLHLPVSTRYAARERTLPRVASAILAFAQARQNGNFIAFFPSYAYLSKARELLEGALDEGTELLVQEQQMDETARAQFLARFTPEPNGRLLALCVLGGAFSEGVDLPAERLCGAAIVGVGLPQVGVERDTLKARYEENYGSGYAYAYAYPGLGKVLQAAGRIIRSERDRGALLLIDNRYAREDYRALLPPHWSPIPVRTDAEITARTAQFFGE